MVQDKNIIHIIISEKLIRQYKTFCEAQQKKGNNQIVSLTDYSQMREDKDCIKKGIKKRKVKLNLEVHELEELKDFSNLNLRGVVIRDQIFDETFKFENTNLANTNLEGSKFECDMSSVNFGFAEVSGTIFTKKPNDSISRSSHALNNPPKIISNKNLKILEIQSMSNLDGENYTPEEAISGGDLKIVNDHEYFKNQKNNNQNISENNLSKNSVLSKIKSSIKELINYKNLSDLQRTKKVTCNKRGNFDKKMQTTTDNFSPDHINIGKNRNKGYNVQR